MAGRDRKPYHKGNVKEDLLNAAKAAVHESTLDAITVRGLCAAVGVTPGNFYNHYANLDDLLANLAEIFFQEYGKRVDDARSRHRRPLLRLKAGAREFVHFACENPEVYRLMFGSRVPNLMKEPVYRAASEAAMRKTVTELYGADIYNLEDTAKSQKECIHAYAYFALLNGLARDVIDGLVDLYTPEDIDRFVDRVLDSLLQGELHKDLGRHL